MADLLIRNVPADIVARLDAQASRLGISRNELLQRRLRDEARRDGGPVTTGDLERFSSYFQDLRDDEAMSTAWS